MRDLSAQQYHMQHDARVLHGGPFGTYRNFTTHTMPENPAKYALRTLDGCGNEVILRNTPRNKEQ